MKLKNNQINELPSGIINLEYNESQRMFHFDSEPMKFRTNKWVTLKAMTFQDAMKFCEMMENKYVKGRQSGILPELTVIKLEIELFFELKDSRRKLAGR